MEFLGYERPDGSVGVRNHVAVISSGRCANEMAATIADAVSGAVPISPHLSLRPPQGGQRAGTADPGRAGQQPQCSRRHSGGRWLREPAPS